MSRFGGQRVFIPKKRTHLHTRFAQKVGAAIAGPMSARFGGETISVPNGKSMFKRAAKRIRDTQIREDYDSNTPVRVLVGRYGLGERAIYQILNDTGAEALAAAAVMDGLMV
ncbi:MAG: hypothetical protein HQL52_17510 [Magnetococcales bacterium]|nr:hypothetical protein [Magnetococcales bacterium]